MAGRHPLDQRGTRAWFVLRDQVVAEEPVCWLRLPGCTLVSTTADHVLTVKDRPDLCMVRLNLRGACHHCNSSRQRRSIGELTTVDTSPALRFFD